MLCQLTDSATPPTRPHLLLIPISWPNHPASTASAEGMPPPPPLNPDSWQSGASYPSPRQLLTSNELCHFFSPATGKIAKTNIWSAFDNISHTSPTWVGGHPPRCAFGATSCVQRGYSFSEDGIREAESGLKTYSPSVVLVFPHRWSEAFILYLPQR